MYYAAPSPELKGFHAAGFGLLRGRIKEAEQAMSLMNRDHGGSIT